MKKYNGNISKQLNSLMSERLLVQKTLGNLAKLSGAIRVIYGETYDKYGITIDSLKYYLFLEYLALVMGNDTKCMIVEGDLHSVINPSVVEKDSLVVEGRRRVEQISKILEKLHIKQVSVRLMSDLFSEQKVINLVSKVSTLVKARADLQDMLIPTVLKNRVAQERESGFRYAAEAIGLALCFDLKVGPPREENYDTVAYVIGREVGRKYESIYLRPSYPFSPDFSYYLTHPEVEQYGLTPYKAGSNKLESQRIVLGKTTDQEIRDLVAGAYAPMDMAYANPLVDLATIMEMAEQIKRNEINPTKLGTRIRHLMGYREKLIAKIIQFVREVS
jgi:hypothetical protein